MAEQGLIATVIPEIDESRLNDFLKEFSEKFSDTELSVNVNARKKGSSIGSSDDGDINEESVTDMLSDSGVLGRKIDELVKASKGIDNLLNIGSNVTNISKGLGEATAGISSGALAAGGIAIGVMAIFEIAKLMWERIKGSSELLQTVWGLLENAVNLILSPIGNIIAITLMPLLSYTYERIGRFLQNAMKVYEEGGWGPLLLDVMMVGLEILGTMLGYFSIVIAHAIWDISRHNIECIAGATVRFVNWMGDVFTDAFQSLCDAVVTIANWIKRLYNAVVEFLKAIPNFFGNMFGTISDTVTKIVINPIGDGVGQVTNFVGGGVNTIGQTVNNGVNTLSNTVGNFGTTIVNNFSGLMDTESAEKHISNFIDGLTSLKLGR